LSKYCLSNIPAVKSAILASVRDLLDDPRLTLMGLFAETFDAVGGKALPSIAEHGLVENEFTVLLRLARSPGGRLRMSDLSAQMSMTASGVTRVVDRLVERSLLCREACTADRRSTYAVIGPAGLGKLEEILPVHLELIQQWLLDPLTDEQREQLAAILRVLRDRLRPNATAGAAGRLATVPAPAGSAGTARTAGTAGSAGSAG
jgi:MarR family 2-MHQ and catechol resistance regulon transcriptional repressor